MDWQKLCTNCMLATVSNNVCPCCGMNPNSAEKRDLRTLPARYMLHKRYYIGKTLGAGGFGVTYLAYDCMKKSRVAVKELFPSKDAIRDQGTGEIRILKGQEEYFEHIKQRFMEEAKTLFQFQSLPSIVNVFQFFEENNTAYYVMEYLEGTDLKHLLKQHGKLSWERLSGYSRVLLKTLDVLHCQNMIHRDISPDNIFLTKDGRTMLIDFGSVRCYNNSNGFTTFLKECFAPIEQYREKGKQGPWTDVYSLCITMYYALSGVMPPKAPDRIQNDKAVPIKKLCPDLPDHVAGAITRGMAVRQEERFQSVRELANQLFTGEQLFEKIQGPQVMIQPSKGHQFVCTRGYFAGKRWNFQAGVAITLGRDARCTIAYPPDSRGISRMQCSLMLDRQGRLYVRDEKSTYGTFLNGEKLQAMTWYRITERCSISFAKEIYQIF